MDLYFPGGRENRKAAYNKIESYLSDHGFSHPLKSGYLSEKLYDDSEVIRFIVQFFQSEPWLEKCMSKCHITIVKDDLIDALAIFQAAKEYVLDEMKDLSLISERKPSLDEQIRKLEEKRNIHLQKAEGYNKEIQKLKEKSGR